MYELVPFVGHGVEIQIIFEDSADIKSCYVWTHSNVMVVVSCSFPHFRLKDSDLKVSSEKVAEVAKKTEKELYSFFQGTDSKYKSKYRSLTFNLKDTKNNVSLCVMLQRWLWRLCLQNNNNSLFLLSCVTYSITVLIKALFIDVLRYYLNEFFKVKSLQEISFVWAQRNWPLKNWLLGDKGKTDM